MRTIRGTTFKTVKRIALPTTGFRAANGGFTASKSRFEEALVSTRIFGGLIKVDAAVADALEDGRAGMVAAESSGVMESALRELGSQIWYGTSNDANGFGGLKDFTVTRHFDCWGCHLSVHARRHRLDFRQGLQRLSRQSSGRSIAK